MSASARDEARPGTSAPAAVVLIHGTRTSSTQWDLQRPILEAAGRTVLAPDLPGHGARRDEDFTLEAAIATIDQALAQAAERSATGTAHLVGCSLGAMLAIRAAAELPAGPPREALASLVVSGGSVDATPRAARLYGLGMRAVDLLPGGDAATSALLRAVLGAEGAQACLAGGRADARVIAPAMAAVASLDLRRDLARISAPVTILNGRADQLRVHERSFARAAPHGRLVVLPYGTHMVNLTHPRRYAADLLRILEDAERPRTLGP
ncbi:alpha/beta fold hydrolase [Brachybacterium phenoliresistens]|uniref:Hydrolase n=1 Tax=Brachybacterium phenoliresistens TaxID=396014 RepID=Z9JQ93_9MICO|nr:alpha/beta hydrolase [Brachybacterium phenoliresistens]EWS80535.1 hydrolase [Brachybacterium phenoliresistens]